MTPQREKKNGCTTSRPHFPLNVSLYHNQVPTRVTENRVCACVRASPSCSRENPRGKKKTCSRGRGVLRVNRLCAPLVLDNVVFVLLPMLSEKKKLGKSVQGVRHVWCTIYNMQPASLKKIERPKTWKPPTAALTRPVPSLSPPHHRQDQGKAVRDQVPAHRTIGRTKVQLSEMDSAGTSAIIV